jgi:SNW domain-containing protein 1
MAALRAVLPPASAPVMAIERPRATKTQSSAPSVTIPPYGQRKGWVPRDIADFGDGGAFPEIHVAQYPLEMGRKKTPSNSKAVIPVFVDGDGKVKYDALLHNNNSKAIIYSKHADAVASEASEEALAKPDPEEAEKTTEKTKSALLSALRAKTTGGLQKLSFISISHNSNLEAKNNDPVFIKYTPQSAGSDGQEKIIRLVEVQKDPLEPPKFKNTKIPVLNTEAPAPVMHSPPRKATQEEIQDWKIPPCVSNWKNPRGYTIPLDKRLAADGRGLQQPHINDSFAKIAEVTKTEKYCDNLPIFIGIIYC